MATPTHRSRPTRSAVSAAATEESTPPDMATMESTAAILRSSALGRSLKESGRLRFFWRDGTERNPERHLGSREVVLGVGLVLGRALRRDVAAVSLDDLLRHRQAETRSRSALVAHPVGVEERVEDPLRLVRQHALALVVDLEHEPLRVSAHAQQHEAAVRAELDGVVGDVRQGLLQLPLVAPAGGGERVGHQLDGDAARLGLWLLLVDHRLGGGDRIEVVAVDRVAAALQRGEVDQVVDGAREALRRGLHRLEDLALRVAERTGLLRAEDLEVAGDGRERRGELVREVLHELRLAPRARAQPRVRGGQLADGRFQPLDQRLRVLAQVAALVGGLDLLALALEELAELARELLHVDGLLDVAVAADAEREPPVAVRGQHHDRTAVQAPVRPESGGGLVAVDAGHLDVAEDQVRMGGDGQVDAGDAVGGLQDVESPGLEHVPHQRPAFRVVLDVEDARLRRRYLFGHRGTSRLHWGPCVARWRLYHSIGCPESRCARSFPLDAVRSDAPSVVLSPHAVHRVDPPAAAIFPSLPRAACTERPAPIPLSTDLDFRRILVATHSDPHVASSRVPRISEKGATSLWISCG